MKSLKKYNTFESKDVDPFGEEIWQDDPITLKIRKLLSEKLKLNRHMNQERINTILDNLGDSSHEDSKVYTITRYVDGGPNDRGNVIGYVKARNVKEAKAIAYIKGFVSIDVFFSGFVEFRLADQIDIDRKIHDLEEKLNKLKNIPSVDEL